jgi:hypothetical protein
MKGQGVMQRSARTLVIAGSLTLVLGSAVYLYVVRGPALLLDLAATGRALFCF